MPRNNDFKPDTYKRLTGLTKSRLESIKTDVEDLQTRPDAITGVQRKLLRVYANEINRKYEDFLQNLTRATSYDEEDAIPEETLAEDQNTISKLYAYLSAVIEDLLGEDDQQEGPSINALSDTSIINNCAARLPKLELIKFNGEYANWTTFINLFNTTIHSNQSLSKILKFQYLLSVLSGEPLNLVRNLSLTDANYDIAYGIIHDRYQNDRRLQLMYINHVIDLPNISCKHIAGIRQFLNTFSENIQALNAIECNITEPNQLLSSLLLRKLDVELRKRLETSRDSINTKKHTLPTVNEIIDFLTLECSRHEDAVCSLGTHLKDTHLSNTRDKPFCRTDTNHKHVVASSSMHTGQLLSCAACNKSDHKTYACPKFLGKTPQERYELIKSSQYCISCLGKHNIKSCKSQSVCKVCHKKHNTLLHFPSERLEILKCPTTEIQPGKHNSPTKEFQETAKGNKTVSLYSQNNASQGNKHTTVLLGTVLVNLRSISGITHTFRALLDSGSMCSLITERAVNLLSTQRQKSSVQILGINQQVTRNKGQTVITLETLTGHQVITNHPMVILDKLTINLPCLPVSSEVIQLTQHLILADPTFHSPSRIDVILGADLFPLILTGQSISLGHKLPNIIDTPFGQVIMGTTPCVPSSSVSTIQASTFNVCLHSTNRIDLHDSIQQFWLQEEIPSHNIQSEEDNASERFFIDTHMRDDSGRYVVRLPFKDSKQALGTSRPAAEHRLNAMERKFSSNERFASLYCDFMQEYQSLGHMTECEFPTSSDVHYFLPHHGILKETSSTTKLRTVFDGSCKTSTGFSLNDLLLTGKKLQTNIADILTQFRRHHIVICCDIKQMYRQILIHPDDRNFQLILWRSTTDKPIKSFQLNTVTYGVNSSPYLAIRTLHQLAIDEGHDFPEAADALLHHTYVDDIITGAESVQSAIGLQKQLSDLLQRGGFELRKWISNSDQLLQQIPDAHRETPKFISESTDPHFSVLGLQWSPTSDMFSYTTHGVENTDKSTKRTVLSAISKIYDPCGFLTPFIFLAKCFMQLIWTLGLAWDTQLPTDIQEQWTRLVAETQWLPQVSIPRTLDINSLHRIELHGFCDASENGYAAVIYFRCERVDSVTTNLVVAKSRVAPLKRVTIPRLELCAAHLLARLVSHYVTLFPNMFNSTNIYLWSDSTVALTWIHTPPYRLKTYVGNRVAQIQEFTSSECWNHISSHENPADCASRGLPLSQLIQHNLWWKGPPWLQLPSCDWPSREFTPITLSNSTELKSNPLPVFNVSTTGEWSLLTKYSSWSKLLRIMALILRFIVNCKRIAHITGPITVSELNAAKIKVYFIAVQQVVFAKEFNEIKQGNCPNSLRKLNPFVDDQQLIRVGGRLSKSSLAYETKHPVLLPKRHHVVAILIDYFHLQYLHAGPQLVQSMLTRQVWILNARNVIRLQIHKCIKCFRHRPTNLTPFMADLPPVRTEPAKPFASTGIDYCGPFSVKVINLRFTKLIKVYLCIFICMVTKAVHIEVVTDLTTDAFIAALTRFISRRGICSDIYSDCGTNFVGAESSLRKIVQSTVTNDKSRQQLQQFSSTLSLRFHFNPPAAPHHGGLWERAVKSVKHHLVRVMGTTVLTLPELMTLSTRIEAILNSRPLTPISSDPSDFSVLTPGHFLTGAPLTALPETNMTEIPSNRLKHWHQVQQLSQRIWKRWSMEYLHTLQQRNKWTSKSVNLKVGDLVLMKTTENTLYWPLARIIEVFPGSDNTVRVAKIKTPNGEYVRPATQLCLLPQNESN